MYVGCKDDFSEAVLWNASRLDQLVTVPCSELHSNFHYGVSISRYCNSDGTWSPVNLRNCTMLTDSQPVVIVYFTLESNSTTINKNVSCYYMHYQLAISLQFNITQCYILFAYI